MSFKEIADLDCTKTLALGGFNRKTNKNNPTKAEGYYVGSRQVASPKSKTGFAFLHVFTNREGNFGIWGKTDLDKKISAGAVVGALTRITFTGMQETKNNPMYKYKVEVNLADTIEVSTDEGHPQYENNPAGNTAQIDEPYEAEEVYEEEAVEEQLPPPARPPARQAQAPDAARQAKMQALLKSRKTA